MHNHSSFKPAQRNKEDIRSSKPNFPFMKIRSRNWVSKKEINRNSVLFQQVNRLLLILVQQKNNGPLDPKQLLVSVAKLGCKSLSSQQSVKLPSCVIACSGPAEPSPTQPTSLLRLIVLSDQFVAIAWIFRHCACG